MIVAVDFDGTCVENRWPELGADVPGAVETLQQWSDDGVKIILWTCRSGMPLQAAVEWFNHNNIPLFGVNTNPEQIAFSTSPKIYAHKYVDDAAAGCPLIEGNDLPPYVDWLQINLTS